MLGSGAILCIAICNSGSDAIDRLLLPLQFGSAGSGPTGPDHYGLPTKEKGRYRSRHSSVYRPGDPCEATSRSKSTTAEPSADCAPYLTTCENPATLLRRSTVPRTQPASGQW